MRTLVKGLVGLFLLTSASALANTLVGWGSGPGTNCPAGLGNIKALAAGYDFSLALMADGSVAAWGVNYGSYSPTNVPADLTDAITIAAGFRHGLAVRSNGLARAWGWNNAGQSSVPEGLSNVVAVSAGGRHSLALKGDGTVMGWGQYLDSDSVAYKTLDVGVGLTNVAAIASGSDHDVFLLSNGVVLARGFSNYGYNQTVVPDGLTNVVAIAAGGDASLALTADRRLVFWGNESYGQQDIPSNLTNVLAIAAGYTHNLALRGTGVVKGWGNNSAGQSTPPNSLSNVLAVVGGYQHSLALVGETATPLQLACPGNLVLTNDAGLCSCSNVTYTVQASGGSGVVTIVSTPPSGSTFPLGITLVTNTASDGQGNSARCVFSVTVLDREGPVITCPTHLVLAADSGRCSCSNVVFTVDATDNCGPAEVVSTPPSGSTFPVGDSIVTNTATDLNGNTAVRTFRVTVQDSQAPVVNCPANLVLSADPGQCARANVTFSVGTSDNCGWAGVTSVPPSGSTFPVGTTVVTNTATDDHGNQSVCFFSVTVTDDEAPVVSCPVSVVLGSDLGQCSRSNVTFTVSANDNCGPAGVTSEPLSGGTFPLGTTFVTNTAVDSHGNQSTRLFAVTITNSSPPVLVCPGDMTLIADAGQASRSNVVFEVGASGTCGAVSVVSAPPSGSTFPLGDTLVTSTATDSFGNSATCTFVVTILPAPLPPGSVVAWGSGPGTNCPAGLGNVRAVFAGQDYSLALLRDGTVRAWGVSYGTYSPTNVPADLTGTKTLAAGVRHVLAVTSDGLVRAWGWNNQGQSTVPNNVSNVIAVAAGETHSLALRHDGTVVSWGKYLDLDATEYKSVDVGAGLTNVAAIASGYNHDLLLLSNGVVVAAGFSNYGKNQTAVPEDLTNAIAISACGDASLVLTADGRLVFWGTESYGQQNIPAGLRDISAISAGYTHDLALRQSGLVRGWGDNTYGQSTPPASLSNVVAVAAGYHHSLAVIGGGIEPLELVCPGDLVFSADAGQCGRSNVTFAVGTSGGSAPVSITSVPPSGSTFPIGTTYVTNTAVDAQGLSATCVFGVTVADNEPPVVTCPADLSLVADAGQHSRSNVIFVVEAADNCGGTQVVSIPPSGSTFSLGTTVVTNAATDLYGNTALCTFTVVVTEPEPPNPDFTVSKLQCATGVFSVSVPTVQGRSYRLEFKHSLLETNWTPLETVPGDGSQRLLTTPAADPQRFFRVRQW